jgi:hypothetical protein
MKATLQFNLDDRDDSVAHQRCIKALDMALALFDFSAKLRRIIDISEDGKWLDEDVVSKAFYETLEEHNIIIDRLLL